MACTYAFVKRENEGRYELKHFQGAQRDDKQHIENHEIKSLVPGATTIFQITYHSNYKGLIQMPEIDRALLALNKGAISLSDIEEQFKEGADYVTLSSSPASVTN